MRALHVTGWIIVALLLWPWGAAAVDTRPFGQRLTGPFASLAAGMEWIRFEQAWREGRPERAAVYADRALELDPLSPQGWIRLGEHYIFERASIQNEPDPEERVRWTRTGLDVWKTGQEHCADPGELAMMRGRTMIMYVAELAESPEFPWPGGVRAVREEARNVLLEAEQLGMREAHIALAALRRQVEASIEPQVENE
jgi:hypothetical protein